MARCSRSNSSAGWRYRDIQPSRSPIMSIRPTRLRSFRPWPWCGNRHSLFGVRLLCGVEITHVPPAQIAALRKRAKAAGADIVVVHGETPVEPVAAGTNHAACSCRYVNVLAHPGLITKEEARLPQKTASHWRSPRAAGTTGQTAMWRMPAKKAHARSSWTRMHMHPMTSWTSARKLSLREEPD